MPKDPNLLIVTLHLVFLSLIWLVFWGALSLTGAFALKRYGDDVTKWPRMWALIIPVFIGLGAVALYLSLILPYSMTPWGIITMVVIAAAVYKFVKGWKFPTKRPAKASAPTT